MHALNMFVPITKVDATARLVYGLATAEQRDRAGEICDYQSTKPLYEKWSRAMNAASEGKSLGNLRAMHGRIAAGKITDLHFDDAARQIEICAKVVDDAEWEKVCEGVYTGFSQGGTYADRWRGEDGCMRYTADPTEVSLVDIPCLPEATFQMIKADGAREDMPFRSAEDLTKVGARNSSADLDHIQSMHDHAVALGAACGGASKAEASRDLGGFGDALDKLLADRLRLDKALDQIVPVLDEILERVKGIERQPRPTPISGATHSISKAADAASLSTAEREALSLDAIKEAHRRPMSMGLRS